MIVGTMETWITVDSTLIGPLWFQGILTQLTGGIYSVESTVYLMLVYIKETLMRLKKREIIECTDGDYDK